VVVYFLYVEQAKHAASAVVATLPPLMGVIDAAPVSPGPDRPSPDISRREQKSSEVPQVTC
jgi:hypothetical protein